MHYLTYPTNATYACGADAVGRRNTRTDTDPLQTSCPECYAYLLANNMFAITDEQLHELSRDEQASMLWYIRGWMSSTHRRDYDEGFAHAYANVLDARARLAEQRGRL